MKDETKQILAKTADSLRLKFYDEALHIANSGAYNEDEDAVCTLIRVALENIAMLYDKGNSRTYKKLSRI